MSHFKSFHQVVQTRVGPMIVNVNDKYIGRSLSFYGEFSELEADLFRQMVRPGDIAADVGANIGAHTLPLAHAVGLAGSVYAFEPQRIPYQALCGNLALSSITNVHAIHCALGTAPGTLKVPPLDYGAHNNFGGLGLGTHQEGEDVDVRTLDSFRLPQCRLIKIDVEGMEEAVLRGATATIEAFRPALYVENDRAARSLSLMTYIESLGYQMYWHLTPLYNPRNYRNQTENVFGNVVSVNLLCIHRATPSQIAGLTPAHPGDSLPKTVRI